MQTVPFMSLLALICALWVSSRCLVMQQNHRLLHKVKEQKSWNWIKKEGIKNMACASNIILCLSLWTSAQLCMDPLDSPLLPFSLWMAGVVVFRSPQRCLCTGDTSWPEPACRSESWCRPSSWCSWCSGFYWTWRGESGLKINII